MSVELLQTLSLASYIGAGVFLLVGIALFFLLDVPKLYGDISGRTARKAIEAIRKQNESTGTKAYKPSPVNAARGRVTDKMTKSGKLIPVTDDLPVHVGTEKFATDTLIPQGQETTVLSGAVNETTVLAGNQSAASETTILAGYQSTANETTVLTGTVFSVDVEMHFAESSEIIE